MRALPALCVFLALQSHEGVKPPKVAYDKARDVTVYSTGDVRTGGFSGMSAEFEAPGHAPAIPVTAPTKISMGFGSLRLTNGLGPEHDNEALHWLDIKTISLTFAGQTKDFPAEHSSTVSKNNMVKLIYGRALEESMSITVTPTEFQTMAAADSIEVVIGKDKVQLKGKTLAPLRKLAAAIPKGSSTEPPPQQL